jgi:hypothetical protein
VIEGNAADDVLMVDQGWSHWFDKTPLSADNILGSNQLSAKSA